MNRPLFLLVRLSHVLWLRAMVFCILAVAAALVARSIGPYVPLTWISLVGEDAVEELLSVLASSMLAVATFSLATMVAAIGSVTSSTSPRAATLLLEDRSAQSALSIFIAAFIFSIVGLIALSTDFYGASERFVLFVETLIVLAFVVLRLLRWIDQLSHLGRVAHVVDRVEAATRKALNRRLPRLGGLPAVPVPDGAIPLAAHEIGYVKHIDMKELHRAACRRGLKVHLQVLPGTFVYRSQPIALLETEGTSGDGENFQDLLKAFVIGDTRTFEQDPQFGLVVLAEIASRALSPAVNDPGTAIDVVGTAARILSTWADAHWDDENPGHCNRIYVPVLPAQDLFDDVFRPIARDGAGVVEVGIALQKAFLELADKPAAGFIEAAHSHSSAALARATQALNHAPDIEAIRRIAETVESKCRARTCAPGGLGGTSATMRPES